jgi:hypothetical protein
MKRVLHVFALLCLLGVPISVRAQVDGTVTISVTNVAANIILDHDAYSVVIRENSASPTAVFSITPSGGVAHNYAAGAQFVFTAKKCGGCSPFKSGTTIGTIVATTAGPFSFTADESIGDPSLAAKNGTGTSGGGDTIAKYVIGAADGALANAVVFFDLTQYPDVPPASPNAKDDEFNASSFNGGSLWTLVNTTGATFTESSGGFLDFNSLAAGAGSNNIQMIVQSLPAAPWQFATKMEMASVAENFHSCGVVLRESATGKIDFFAIQTGPMPQVVMAAWTGPTAFSATRFAGTNNLNTNAGYFKVGRSGSTLTFYFSYNGVAWLSLYSEALTTFFTTAPDQVGLACNSSSASNSTDGIFWSFRRVL